MIREKFKSHRVAIDAEHAYFARTELKKEALNSKSIKKKGEVPDPRAHELNFWRCPYCLMLLPGPIDKVKVCIWCHERTDEKH